MPFGSPFVVGEDWQRADHHLVKPSRETAPLLAPRKPQNSEPELVPHWRPDRALTAVLLKPLLDARVSFAHIIRDTVLVSRSPRSMVRSHGEIWDLRDRP